MAQFGNLPEVVIFTEFGVDHKALVIGARSLEHHEGENEEPMLDLVIVAPLVPDACVNCGNPQGRHNVPMPPGNNFAVCGAFVPPEPRRPANSDELVQIKHGVPHETHSFDDSQLKAIAKSGVSVEQAYPGRQIPGGRWRELAVQVAAVPEAAPPSVDPPAKPEPPTSASETIQ